MGREFFLDFVSYIKETKVKVCNIFNSSLTWNVIIFLVHFPS